MIKKIILLLLLASFLPFPCLAQTRPHWVQIQGKPFVDVREYGAVAGDSSASVAAANTTAFQSAIDAGSVYVPDGVWYIDAVLTLPGLSSMEIKGGKSALIIQTTATEGIFDIGTFGSQNSSIVTIERLTLKQGAYAINAASQEGLIVRDCQTFDHTDNHIVLDGCYLSSLQNVRCSAGVDCDSIIKIMRGSQNVTLYRVDALSNRTGVGIEIVGPLVSVFVDDCDIEGNNEGIKIHKSEAGRLDTILVSRSSFELNDYHVSIASYSAYGGDAYDKAQGIELSNNYMTGNASFPGVIYVDRVEDLVLQNNSFYYGTFETTANAETIYHKDAFGWADTGSNVTFDIDAATNYQEINPITKNGVVYNQKVRFSNATNSWNIVDNEDVPVIGYLYNLSRVLVKNGLYFSGTSTQLFFAAAAPTSGTWVRGSVVFNLTPAAGGKAGWICVTAGTPGTWKAFGVIDP